MKLLIVSACLSLVAVHGYSVRQPPRGFGNVPILDDDPFESEAANDVMDPGSDVEERGHLPYKKCWCIPPFGCYCSARTSKLTVTVTISLDEVPMCNQRLVVAAFNINRSIRFDVLFPLDRIENFCHMVDDVAYCFRIQVSTYYETCSQQLHGCISISKPTEMDIGCFKLPKIAVAGVGCAVSMPRTAEEVDIEEGCLEEMVVMDNTAAYENDPGMGQIL